MHKPTVFISYPHSDEHWAREFAESLKGHGLSVWFDKFVIQPGESFRDALEKGLRDSDLIVTLISPESVHRPNLFFELGAALGMGKRIVAIVPEDFDVSQLPQSLRLRRTLRKHSPQATAEELVSETADLRPLSQEA